VQVDAQAASEAASKGLTGNGDRQQDPLRTLVENMSTSIQTTVNRVVTRFRQLKNILRRGIAGEKLIRFFKNLFRDRRNKDEGDRSPSITVS
jgi:hypothetical protein